MRKIYFIDHYDSFSSNVLDWLWRGGIDPAQIDRIFFDDLKKMSNLVFDNSAIVFGPGPHAPADVPTSCQLATAALGKVPLFGLCLGHQILGYITGAAIKQRQEPWHGTTEELIYDGDSRMFQSLSRPVHVAIYNSLVVEFSPPEPSWKIVARNSFGDVMAMTYDSESSEGTAAWGVQFHPESFLTQSGQTILKNWMNTFS